NVISNVNFGITIYNSKIPEIRKNNVNFSTTTSSIVSYGISIHNANSSSVGSNSGLFNNIVTGNVSTTNPDDWGISSNMSFYNIPIQCNEIKKAGTALHFGGVLNSSQLTSTP